jgi:hypothetical protein
MANRRIFVDPRETLEGPPMDISYTTAVVARQIGRARWATVVIAVMSGLLFLDGQLGPVSFQLRRLAAGVVLVSVAIAG